MELNMGDLPNNIRTIKYDGQFSFKVKKHFIILYLLSLLRDYYMSNSLQRYAIDKHILLSTVDCRSVGRIAI